MGPLTYAEIYFTAYLIDQTLFELERAVIHKLWNESILDDSNKFGILYWRPLRGEKADFMTDNDVKEMENDSVYQFSIFRDIDYKLSNFVDVVLTYH